MEENKYYTPDLHEFCLDFEYLFRISLGLPYESYKLTEYASLEKINEALQSDLVKVKYLDKEDIEAEGFKFINEDERRLIFRKDSDSHRFKTIELLFNPVNNWVLIYKGGNFAGTIKNKSELKRILKMIGV
jgi:hypothetical protein